MAFVIDPSGVLQSSAFKLTSSSPAIPAFPVRLGSNETQLPAEFLKYALTLSQFRLSQRIDNTLNQYVCGQAALYAYHLVCSYRGPKSQFIQCLHCLSLC